MTVAAAAGAILLASVTLYAVLGGADFGGGLWDLLAGGERPVNDLVALLGLAQPLVSKHLRVLREVGLVDVRGDGRQRVYRLNAAPLKPIYDWVRPYEQAWSQRFSQLDAVLEELKAEEDGENGRDE